MRLNLSRRDFLHVGVVGGLGLTLADFLRLKEARGDIKTYATVEGTAKKTKSSQTPIPIRLAIVKRPAAKSCRGTDSARTSATRHAARSWPIPIASE